MTNGVLDPQDTFPGCPGRWAGKPLGWGALCEKYTEPVPVGARRRARVN